MAVRVKVAGPRSIQLQHHPDPDSAAAHSSLSSLSSHAVVLPLTGMGCVYSSRGHSSARDPDRSFHVVNVDDRGNEINAGHIQITDTDLILRQGESSILWPLRRCPTGPGIYAFRCGEAEQLFNNLQEAINKCTSYPLIASAAAGQQAAACGPVPAGADDSAGRESLHQPSPAHSYVNAIHNYISSPIYNGQSSDQSISLPLTSHELPTTGVTDINTNYAKLDDLVRYYVNISTPVTPGLTAANDQTSVANSTPTPPASDVLSERRKSAVLGNGSIASRRNQTVVQNAGASVSSGMVSRFQFPPAVSHFASSPSKSLAIDHPLAISDSDPVNYILLDLDTTTPAATPAPNTHFVSTAPATPVSKTPKSEMVWPTPPDTQMPGTPTSVGSAGGSISNGPRMSYAMIDFDKTEALTSAANQRKGLSIGSSS